MAGLSSSPSGDLAFNLNRWRYRGQAALCLVVTLVLAAALIGGKPPVVVFLMLTIVLALHFAGLLSVLKILSLGDPVLLVDGRGIFDKRVTREIVPWTKMSGVHWASVRVGIGNRRLAGIGLAPWTYLGTLRYGTIAWDDVVINPQGLACDPHPGYWRLATLIADHAEAMRAKHGRVQGETV